MKEFFEEYGRTIVTVLVILGIILVGYVTAGNGRSSAFGRFTTDVVDSLSGQANSLLIDSPQNFERTAKNRHTIKPGTYKRGETEVSAEAFDGGIRAEVTGKSIPDWSSGKYVRIETEDCTSVPWGKASVMSFDFYADNDCSLWIDFNAITESITDNDIYASGKGGVYVNGARISSHSQIAPGWHHMTVILWNKNENKNPEHEPFSKVFNYIYIGQEDGTHRYQIKNLKYGVAD